MFGRKRTEVPIPELGEDRQLVRCHSGPLDSRYVRIPKACRKFYAQEDRVISESPEGLSAIWCYSATMPILANHYDRKTNNWTPVFYGAAQ